MTTGPTTTVGSVVPHNGTSTSDVVGVGLVGVGPVDGASGYPGPDRELPLVDPDPPGVEPDVPLVEPEPPLVEMTAVPDPPDVPEVSIEPPPGPLDGTVRSSNDSRDSRGRVGRGRPRDPD